MRELESTCLWARQRSAAGCSSRAEASQPTVHLSLSSLRPALCAGYTTCCSSAELSCELTGDAGCKTCAPGYYRCYKVLPNRQVVVGCCPCNGARARTRPCPVTAMDCHAYHTWAA